MSLIDPSVIILGILDVEILKNLYCVCWKYNNTFNNLGTINILRKKFDVKDMCEDFPEFVEFYERWHYSSITKFFANPSKLLRLSAEAGNLDGIRLAQSRGALVTDETIKYLARGNYVSIANTLIREEAYERIGGMNEQLVEDMVKSSAIGYAECGNNEELTRLFNTCNFMNTRLYTIIMWELIRKNNKEMILFMLSKSLIAPYSVYENICYCNKSDLEFAKEISSFIEQSEEYPLQPWMIDFDQLKKKLIFVNDKTVLSHALFLAKRFKLNDCYALLKEKKAVMNIDALDYAFKYNETEIIVEIFNSHSKDMISEWMNEFGGYISSKYLDLMIEYDIKCSGAFFDLDYGDIEKIMKISNISKKKAEKTVLSSALGDNNIAVFRKIDMDTNLLDHHTMNAIRFGKRRLLIELLKRDGKIGEADKLLLATDEYIDFDLHKLVGLEYKE